MSLVFTRRLFICFEKSKTCTSAYILQYYLWINSYSLSVCTDHEFVFLCRSGVWRPPLVRYDSSNPYGDISHGCVIFLRMLGVLSFGQKQMGYPHCEFVSSLVRGFSYCTASLGFIVLKGRNRINPAPSFFTYSFNFSCSLNPNFSW